MARILLNFSKSTFFHGASFHRARFHGVVNFSGVEIHKCGDFVRCYSPQVVFKDAVIENANFDHAYMEEANFQSAQIQNGTFQSACLVEANFKNANLKNTCFTRANLKRAVFDHADLDAVDFENARLKAASFAGVKNWKTITNFRNAYIAGIKFAPVGFLQWAISRGATTNGIRYWWARLTTFK